MQLNKEETNSDENDSIEKVNKYMIPEQSFDVSLDDWGTVKFPYRFEDNTLIGFKTGAFDSVSAVAFRDINDDKKDDIIIITYFLSGVGPTGMVPRPSVRIYLAAENEFYLEEDMMVEVEDYLMGKDATIESFGFPSLLRKEGVYRL